MKICRRQICVTIVNMSLVRLQIDQWLIAAREFLTKQDIDSINSVLKARKIRLTHSTFLHYTNEFALLLEKRGNKSAWEITSKITSYFVSYHLPTVSNKRPIIMNHFHIPNYDSLIPAFDSMKISVPGMLAEQASSSSSSVVDTSKASTSEVDSNTRKDDVTKPGILFPIVCKLRRCNICMEFRETLVVCKSDKCKRKHRGGLHYLTHAQRRKLSRLHKFCENKQQQNPEIGQTSGESINNDPAIISESDTGVKANGPAHDRDVDEGKLLPPRKRRLLSWVEEVELELP